MPASNSLLKKLLTKKNEIIKSITNLSVFRPGTLIERYRKCGKPNCHCAKIEAKGHGPQWSLTRAKKGKTITKIIPTDAVTETKKQIVEYQKFTQYVSQLVDVNTKICDELLTSNKEQISKTTESEKKGF
jgi:hypothetical protein